jgi:hypothetical protein
LDVGGRRRRRRRHFRPRVLLNFPKKQKTPKTKGVGNGILSALFSAVFPSPHFISTHATQRHSLTRTINVFSYKGHTKQSCPPPSASGYRVAARHDNALAFQLPSTTRTTLGSTRHVAQQSLLSSFLAPLVFAFLVDGVGIGFT